MGRVPSPLDPTAPSTGTERPRRRAPFTGGSADVAAAVLVAGAALLLSWAFTPRGTVENDVNYYFAWVRLVPEYGFSEILPEYPTPVMLLLWLPILVVSTEAGYRAVFVGASLVVAAAAVAMMRLLPDGRAARTAAIVVALCVGAVGPLGLYRFDLLPGALLAFGCVLLARRPATGSRAGWSVAVALATGIKLWPIIAWPLGLGDRGARRREVAGFAATGAALVAGSLLAAGWDRLLSPLGWQSGRGLQVESVWATWVLAARLVSPSTWEAQLSDANSWDFSGPGVAATLTVAGLAQVGLAAWVVALTWRVWRSRVVDPVVVSVTATSVVAVFVATDKVFSPQYMLWLAPVAAVACGLGRGGAAVPSWWAPTLVVACALTQLSYPTTYGWLYPGDAGPAFLLGTLVMATRNALMVALAVSTCRAAWRLTARRAPAASFVSGPASGVGEPAPVRTIDEGGPALVTAGDHESAALLDDTTTAAGAAALTEGPRDEP